MTAIRRTGGITARAPGLVVVAVVAIVAVVIVGAAVALGATGRGPETEPVRITVRNVAFEPREIQIRAGEEVAWFFADGGTFHDVVVEGVDDNPGFRSEGAHRRSFPEPGVYRVTCSIHPQMVGTVVVRPET